MYENQDANKLRELQKIPKPSLEKYHSSKRHMVLLEVPFCGNSRRGRGCVYLVWFVDKLIYFIIDAQNCFIQT